jgi:outer membrane protein W
MSIITRFVGSAIALSAALIPSVAGAQRAGDITIGIMAGGNYSTVEQDPDPGDVEFDYKGGLVAGGFLGYQLTDMFSIEPQVLFSQKGAKVKGVGSTASLEGDIRVNYVAVPVLLKVWFPMSNSQVKPFLFAGPEVAFKVGCTAEGTILAVTGERDCDETNGEIKLKGTDFGLAGGGGLQFNAGTNVVRIDARYTWGLTDINDSGDNREIKNRAFSATIGFGIPLPR